MNRLYCYKQPFKVQITALFLKQTAMSSDPIGHSSVAAESTDKRDYDLYSLTVADSSSGLLPETGECRGAREKIQTIHSN